MSCMEYMGKYGVWDVSLPCAYLWLHLNVHGVLGLGKNDFGLSPGRWDPKGYIVLSKGL